MNAADKRALLDWNEFRDSILKSTEIDYNEKHEDKVKRIARLEANPEEWFKYYFPNYCYAEAAAFHKKATRRVLSHLEWYEVRAWSRELAKSARTMMEVIYLCMTGKKRSVMLASSSYDNAVRLLTPYKLILQYNQRLENDYEVEPRYGDWSDGEFTTKQGVTFRAIGAGQSPRGTRKEEVRPDVWLFDDIDTDEDCRNPDTIDKKWEWIERAAFASRSISNPLLVVFCGNIIAEYCCITKAIEMADHTDVINIRDANGKSSWPQKNSEEDIERVLSKISYSAAQGEYYNNPITNGKIFPALHYKKLQPLRDYRFLVSYCDPSYKSGKKNDFKAVALVGAYKDEFHVLKVYCAQTTTADMIDWHYELLTQIRTVPVYYMIEWPWIDDSLKIELQAANTKHKMVLPLTPDPREKPEKFFRIESLLEPLNRREKLWFNIDMKDSQHMKAMEAQFKALSPTSRAHDDGPDAVEGAIFTINQKTTYDISRVNILKKHTNPKRY